MSPAAASRVQAPPLAPSRRPRAVPRPRRVSGPARPGRAGSSPQAQGGLAVGLLGLIGRLDALASHRLLDRLIRSRVWIGIVAFALIGIVTLQLGLLKLNAGIGRALEREGALQRENAALSVENSELSLGSRVESQAQQLGMRLSSVAGLQFLSAHKGDAARAAAALSTATAREPASEAATSSEAAPSTSESHAEAGEGHAEAGEGEASSSTGGGEAPAAGTEPEPAPKSEETAAAPPTGESSAVPAGEGGGAAAPAG